MSIEKLITDYVNRKAIDVQLYECIRDGEFLPGFHKRSFIEIYKNVLRCILTNSDEPPYAMIRNTYISLPDLEKAKIRKFVTEVWNGANGNIKKAVERMYDDYEDWTPEIKNLAVTTFKRKWLGVFTKS